MLPLSNFQKVKINDTGNGIKSIMKKPQAFLRFFLDGKQFPNDECALQIAKMQITSKIFVVLLLESDFCNTCMGILSTVFWPGLISTAYKKHQFIGFKRRS